MTTPAAYLRKSKDAATKGDHLAILMDAVKSHGHNGDTVVYDDWARSGDIRKLSKRTGWRALCEAIEQGEHDVVFMNDLDRGGRSVEEWARFMRVARDRGVRVIAGGVDWSAPEKRTEFYLRAVFAEEELERARARSARTKEIRARRGDATVGGHTAPYGSMWARAGDVGMTSEAYPDPRRVVVVPNPNEPLEPILDALNETKGNVLQATKLLNARGVPNRGGMPWEPRTVARIVDREKSVRRRRETRPNVNGANRPTSYRTGTGAPLSRLVECHCGSLMTPVRDRRTKEWASLYCGRGHKAGVDAHGRYVARTRHVLDAIRAEVPRRSRIAIIKSKADPSKRRAELEAELERLGWAVTDGLLTREQARERSAKIATELDDLGDVDNDWVGFGPRTPNIRWDDGDDALNEDLHRLVRVVRIGEDMMPTAVELRG